MAKNPLINSCVQIWIILREGSSHWYVPSCKQIKSVEAIVFELRAWTDKQIDPNALPSHSPPEAKVMRMQHIDQPSVAIVLGKP